MRKDGGGERGSGEGRQVRKDWGGRERERGGTTNEKGLGGRARERGGWDDKSKGWRCVWVVLWTRFGFIGLSRILWGEALVEVTERFGG